jgi:tryptophan synthase beta chain
MNLGTFSGDFGGRFVPETLVPALEELEAAFRHALVDPTFESRLADLRKRFVGRTTPIYEARRLSQACGGARILLKREDLCHTGAHKINNTIGQVLLAERMKKRRVIAETGAGQHGVATAATCAHFGIGCDVYMGRTDMERQALNVLRMRAFGARVIPVTAGSQTLKDALCEALRDWVTNVRTTHYVLGSASGPHPFPTIVRHFQSVIGREAREQCEELGGLPDAAVACVGGGSNAIGLFSAFLEDPVRLIAVEAAGAGLRTGRHAATLARGKPGVLHGARTLVLQDADGQVEPTHSVSAGLDYPAVGPELASLRERGRLELAHATDDQAIRAALDFARLEGILPALESAHAIAAAMRLAKELGAGSTILVGLSGRGDKDVEILGRAMQSMNEEALS